jgi:hypothetical protein
MKRKVPGQYVEVVIPGMVACDTCNCGWSHRTQEQPCDRTPGCAGTMTVVPEIRQQKWVRGYTEVECCGETLICDAFTTTCPNCGADYNWNGDRLAPRSYWGEETGEHWTECY